MIYLLKRDSCRARSQCLILIFSADRHDLAEQIFYSCLIKFRAGIAAQCFQLLLLSFRIIDLFAGASLVGSNIIGHLHALLKQSGDLLIDPVNLFSAFF